MWYCPKCKKVVDVYGVPFSPGIEEEMEKMRKEAESEGKLIMFNPPPVDPYNCPFCGTELIDKDE